MKSNELIIEVLEGNTDSYRELVVLYIPEIRAYISSRIFDPSTIDDLVQETLITAYWNLKQFDMKKNFGAWIQGIAKNKFREYLRSCKSKKQSIFHNSVPLIQCLDRRETQHNHNPELLDQLNECISKLSKNYIELLEKRYMEKISVQQIAEDRKTTVSAISNVLYNLKKQLKLCLRRFSHE
jgi:RNA polymerase sigma-70 factor, ECF subfamily